MCQIVFYYPSSICSRLKVGSRLFYTFLYHLVTLVSVGAFLWRQLSKWGYRLINGWEKNCNPSLLQVLQKENFNFVTHSWDQIPLFLSFEKSQRFPEEEKTICFCSQTICLRMTNFNLFEEGIENKHDTEFWQPQNKEKAHHRNTCQPSQQEQKIEPIYTSSFLSSSSRVFELEACWLEEDLLCNYRFIFI